MSLARFVHLYPDIDNAGGKALATAIDHVLWQHVRFGRALEDARDAAVFNNDGACPFGSIFGVDQPGVAKELGHGVRKTASVREREAELR